MSLTLPCINCGAQTELHYEGLPYCDARCYYTDLEVLLITKYIRAQAARGGGSYADLARDLEEGAHRRA